MVKVTFQQWEEVVIHESIQYKLDELIHMHTIGVQTGGLAPPLNWAEGILFLHAGMPPTDDIVREQLKGRVHWTAVRWALMPTYQKVIVIKEPGIRIPINDVSANEILSEVAKALKETAKV